MKKQILSFFLLFLFSISFLAINSEAKVLPQASKGKTTSRNVVSSGIGVSVKFRADRRAVLLYFSNLQNASSVSYSLTYTQKGQEEGAIGSLNLDKNSASQELLFGTCSKNVCRYHTNITNAKVEVSYTLKSGKKYIKRYKLKV